MGANGNRNDALVYEMYEYYLTGKTLAEVGEVFDGRCATVVWNCFQRRGFPMRPRGPVGIYDEPKLSFNGLLYGVWCDGYYHRTTDPGTPMHKDVWEFHNGIIDDPGTWVVHHLDFNRVNNEISNLALMTREDHSRLHILTKEGLI